MLAQLFYKPVQMGIEHLWLALPLCAVVGVVYKTIRAERLRRLPLQILGLWAYMLLGLVALCVAFYLILDYVA
jgi:hypothetical protein